MITTDVYITDPKSNLMYSVEATIQFSNKYSGGISITWNEGSSGHALSNFIKIYGHLNRDLLTKLKNSNPEFLI